jgi:hypothetical protein
VAVADFNGDSKDDLAIVDGTSINVLLGNGNGTFQTAVSYSDGSTPGALATGDFNKDGKIDLVAVNGGNNQTFSILLGNGNGTFQSHVDYPTRQFPGNVAVGDFDGDGNTDIALGDANGLSVFTNKGDGTLHQAVVAPDFSLTSSAVTPASVSAGQSATATVTVTSIAGFSGSVSLSCSVSPSAADAPTCLLTPVTVQSSGGAAATSALSIASVAPHSLLGPTDPPLSGGSLAVLWLVVSGFLLAGLLLAKGPGRKQLWLNGLFAYTLAGTLAMQVACGGSQNTPTGGTAARSYAINVQGASGATQHSVSVTLNVR